MNNLILKTFNNLLSNDIEIAFILEKKYHTIKRIVMKDLFGIIEKQSIMGILLQEEKMVKAYKLI